MDRRKALEWGTYRSPMPMAAAGGLWTIPPWPPDDAVKLGTADRYLEFSGEEWARHQGFLHAVYIHRRSADEKAREPEDGRRVSPPRRPPEKPPETAVSPEWAANPEHPWVKRNNRKNDPGARPPGFL
jgi:hypothetical protein